MYSGQRDFSQPCRYHGVWLLSILSCNYSKINRKRQRGLTFLSPKKSSLSFFLNFSVFFWCCFFFVCLFVVICLFVVCFVCCLFVVCLYVVWLFVCCLFVYWLFVWLLFVLFVCCCFLFFVCFVCLLFVCLWGLFLLLLLLVWFDFRFQNVRSLEDPTHKHADHEGYESWGGGA